MNRSLNMSHTKNCKYDSTNATCQLGDVFNEETEEVANIPVSITICVFTIFIVGVNIPAALTLFKTKLKHTNINNMQILSLSITDMLVGISEFMITYDFMFAQPISYRSCMSRFFVFASCYFNSMAQVFVLCVCRVYLFFHLKPLINRGRDLALVIAVTFVISTIAMTLPLLLSTLNMDHTKTLKRCNPEVVFDIQLFWTIAALAFSGIEIMIILCYLVLACKLYLHRKKMRKIVPVPSLPVYSVEKSTILNFKKFKSLEARGIITIGVIVLISMICTTPFHGMCIMEMFNLGNSTGNMRNLLIVLASCNSALNPIVYVFMVPEMKKSIKDTCCRSYR